MPEPRIGERHRIDADDQRISRSTGPRGRPRRIEAVDEVRDDRIVRRSADLGDQLLGADVAIRAIARGGERPSEEAPAQPRGDRSGADAQVDDLGPGVSREQRPLEKRVREGPRPPDVVGQLLGAGDDQEIETPQGPIGAHQEPGLREHAANGTGGVAETRKAREDDGDALERALDASRPSRSGPGARRDARGARPCGAPADRRGGDAVARGRVVRIRREAAELGVGTAAADALDDGGDDRLVAEVLVAHVAEDPDPLHAPASTRRPVARSRSAARLIVAKLVPDRSAMSSRR